MFARYRILRVDTLRPDWLALTADFAVRVSTFS
jgi:hypothetical protein